MDGEVHRGATHEKGKEKRQEPEGAPFTGQAVPASKVETYTGGIQQGTAQETGGQEATRCYPARVPTSLPPRALPSSMLSARIGTCITPCLRSLLPCPLFGEAFPPSTIPCYPRSRKCPEVAGRARWPAHLRSPLLGRLRPEARVSPGVLGCTVLWRSGVPGAGNRQATYRRANRPRWETGGHSACADRTCPEVHGWSAHDSLQAQCASSSWPVFQSPQAEKGLCVVSVPKSRKKE